MIYITGINGMLGKAIQKNFKENNISFYGCDIQKSDYSKIDICNYEKLLKDIIKNKPEIIIHTASIIDIELCEQNKEKCFKVNIDGTKNIIKICNELNIKLIYISTSAIFDGEQGNYNEDDIPNPINVYAESKYLAEQEIIRDCKDFLIIRTNIFGWDKNQFAEWCISKILEGKQFDMYIDNIISIIYVEDLVKILWEIRYEKGIINIACKEKISKYEFGKLSGEYFGYNTQMIMPNNMNDNFKVKRPKNISLNLNKLSKFCNIPSIKESLQNFKIDRKFYN
jgi:dTDP-4-dehydrorhamnose reductase